VANQTLQAAELRGELREKISAGPCSFFVIVPDTKAADYDPVAAGGALPHPGMWWWATSYARPATDEEATAQARQRLSLMLAGRGRPGRGRSWQLQPAGGHRKGARRASVRRDHRGHLAPAHLALARGRPAASSRPPVRAAGHDHNHRLLTTRPVSCCVPQAPW